MSEALSVYDMESFDSLVGYIRFNWPWDEATSAHARLKQEMTIDGITFNRVRKLTDGSFAFYQGREKVHSFKPEQDLNTNSGDSSGN